MFVITGCGRSGTKYISNVLKNNGIKCGHEEVFTYKGIRNTEYYDGDASWYAPAYFDEINKNVKIIHLVRDPIKVISSFYRIGLFSIMSWRNFIVNPNPLYISKRLYNNPVWYISRIKHVSNLRKILNDNTNCMNYNDEKKRIVYYWFEWNLLIENKIRKNNMSYIRVNLENIDMEWGKIEERINHKIDKFNINPINQKTSYPNRPIGEIELPKKVRDMACRYGYNY